MSLAMTRVRRIFAAAIASTPDPVPMSSTRRAPPPLGQIIERQQAAAGGAVMAGAEGQRGLDLDADVVGLDARAVMRAMHDEAAGAHRLQTGQAFLDPVGGRDRLDGERGRRRIAGRERDLRAQSGFVRRLAEMDRHLPLAAVALEGGADGVVGAEDLAEIAGEPAGGRLVAGEAGDGGGRVHAQHLPCDGHICPAHW